MVLFSPTGHLKEEIILISSHSKATFYLASVDLRGARGNLPTRKTERKETRGPTAPAIRR